MLLLVLCVRCGWRRIKSNTERVQHTAEGMIFRGIRRRTTAAATSERERMFKKKHTTKKEEGKEKRRKNVEGKLLGERKKEVNEKFHM